MSLLCLRKRVITIYTESASAEVIKLMSTWVCTFCNNSKYFLFILNLLYSIQNVPRISVCDWQWNHRRHSGSPSVCILWYYRLSTSLRTNALNLVTVLSMNYLGLECRNICQWIFYYVPQEFTYWCNRSADQVGKGLRLWILYTGFWVLSTLHERLLASNNPFRDTKQNLFLRTLT